MFNSIIKALIPSSTKLAKFAAQKTQQGFNGYAADKQDVVIKWAALANQIAAVSSQLTSMAVDGKIDEVETDKLTELYKPVFDRLLEVI